MHEAASNIREAELQEAPEGFVIAFTQKRLRRLHFVGCCGKVPGEHYKVFEPYGNLLPPESAFDLVCGVCFRGEHLAPASRVPGVSEEDLEVADSASGSSSSSSSSESAVDSPVKRRKKKCA